jgi:hypothetical protein
VRQKEFYAQYPGLFGWVFSILLWIVIVAFALRGLWLLVKWLF